MRITFLGTGTSQGVPVITCQCEVCRSNDPRDQRLRSSLLVEVREKVIVIDTGPDFRQQMLRYGVMHLDAVLLTHGHKDHTGGLDDIRAFNFSQRAAIDVYAAQEVQDAIERDFFYAFGQNKYPGVPEINIHKINNGEFLVGDISVKPIEVMHFRLPVLGFRIGDLVYITDASYISPLELEKARGCKVFVINGLRVKKHYSHFNLEEALEVITHVGAEQSYITHISHMMGKHADIESMLPEGAHLAWDGLCITL